MNSTSPRRVLVTGAGSGFGHAIAERLARSGDQVIGTVRDPERAREMTEQAKATGLSIAYRALELSDPAQIDSLVQSLGDGLDVLVHNAGMGVYGAVEEVSAESSARQFAVNLFGPLELTRKLLPKLRESKGKVIWIGSLAGRFSMPFQAHYSATKAAIASISDAMRMELAPFGVSVTCVEPGDFATEFTQKRQLPAFDGSPYRERMERCLEAVKEQETGGPGPEWVAKTVEKLSRMKSPPARRPVGRWARMMCLLKDFLPDFVREKLVRQTYRV